MSTKPYPEMVPFAEELTPELGTANAPRELERLRLFWNDRRFLAKATMVGALIGTVLAFALPTRFESSTQLMPPDSQSSTGMAMLASLMGKSIGGVGLGGVAGDLLGMKSSGAVFVGVLRSRTVEDRIIDRFDLQKVYAKRTMEDTRRRLAEKTDIAEERKSGIISITVTDHDPSRSAAIAEAYVEELDRLVGQLSTSAAHKQRVFLEKRLSEVKQDLESAEKEFSQFASKNTAIDIKEQGKAMVEAAALLQGQLIAAQSELEAARQIYTDNNVRVKASQARISELQKRLQELGGSDEPGASAAETKSAAPYPSIRKLPLLGVTYADLYRRTKVDEAVFEVLTQQYEMAKMEEAKDTPSVKVLDVAKIPEKKSFPPRLLVIFLCTVTTLAGAALISVVNDRWRRTDAGSPGKVLAKEVFQSVTASMLSLPPNGSPVQRFSHRWWTLLIRHNGASKGKT
jgi:capsule polysaccharide export protein KpsE/RkpR